MNKIFSVIISIFIIFFCFVIAYFIFPVYVEGLFLYVVISFTIIIGFVFPLFLFFWAHVIEVKQAYSSGCGYYGDKKIDLKNVPLFRDIPCDKDIYYAHVLIKLNRFKFKNTNILGAILLKWVKDGKICFKKIYNSGINTVQQVIDLNLNPVFNYDFEIKLFELLYAASRNGILEPKELSRYVKVYYEYFDNIFNEMNYSLISRMKDMGYIYENISGCKYGHVMGNKIYNDSIQLYGLKKYLDDFSRMDTKEVMEVKLWDEYLMFACLFGISDKVTKQLKKIYPEILDVNFGDFNNMPLGFEMIDFIHDFSLKIRNRHNAR